MKYWILLVSASLLLAACDGDSGNTNADSTFVTPEADAPGDSGINSNNPVAVVPPEDRSDHYRRSCPTRGPRAGRQQRL